MTYKLNLSLGKIQSPVVLIFLDGERKKYQNGAAVVETAFDKMLLIDSLRAVENTVEIVLTQQKMTASAWIGEELTFFEPYLTHAMRTRYKQPAEKTIDTVVALIQNAI